MELADIIEVNELFAPIYPYVAGQIARAYGRQDGLALEMGPFCGGVSLELARLCPEMALTFGDDFPGLLPHFEKVAARSRLGKRIALQPVNKSSLPFPDGTFDLVVFRGAPFFWDDTAQIIREMYRVLRPRGLAMAGGGFGAETPDSVIESLAVRSRELNRRLGKRVLTGQELVSLLEEIGLAPQATIERRHGLWAELRKPA